MIDRIQLFAPKPGRAQRWPGVDEGDGIGTDPAPAGRVIKRPTVATQVDREGGTDLPLHGLSPLMQTPTDLSHNGDNLSSIM